MLGAVTEVLGAEQGGCFLTGLNRGKTELCSEAGMVTCGSLPRERRVRWRQGGEPQPVRDALRLCGPERKQLRSRRRDRARSAYRGQAFASHSSVPLGTFLTLSEPVSRLISSPGKTGPARVWLRFWLSRCGPLWIGISHGSALVPSSLRWEGESSLPRNCGDVRASAECLAQWVLSTPQLSTTKRTEFWT